MVERGSDGVRAKVLVVRDLRKEKGRGKEEKRQERELQRQNRSAKG